MSDRESSGDETQRFPADDETRPMAGADETQRIGRGGPPPPTATQPMYVPGGPFGPSPGRQILLFLLVFLLGLAGGFALGQFLGDDDEQLPDENLVLYENAGMSFPIAGAAFTGTTYDPSTQTCDKEAMKRFLREDPRRFQAWLELQEIPESEFDAFVDRLETRILDKPTPVTNHGCFAEGDGPCPFAIQSVLGPGTPVWYDPEQNRLVAKCACSNPLKAPRCPPNCEDQVPTPTPTPTESPSPTPTAQTPTPTTAPPATEAPTPTPTRPPATLPPTFPPTPSPTTPPQTPPP